jgi:hypothetical protein
MQDRDGALLVLNRRTRRFFPFIKRIFADAGYQGPKPAAAIAKTGTWKLDRDARLYLHLRLRVAIVRGAARVKRWWRKYCAAVPGKRSLDDRSYNVAKLGFERSSTLRSKFASGRRFGSVKRLHQ